MPEGYHLNLAFQGGGAKGVSYVGVYKAVKDMQRRIQEESKGNIPLPIRSVIGSSAGGILSLAISAGIEENDLIDLCYMMDTLTEDRLFSSPQKANEAE
jgi:predicted acylesterase/phospholipase RssA